MNDYIFTLIVTLAVILTCIIVRKVRIAILDKKGYEYEQIGIFELDINEEDD